MGTAGPSGFHSANTHTELLAKAVQIHRLKARGCADRERKSRRGKGEGQTGVMKKQISSGRKEKKRKREKTNRETGVCRGELLSQLCVPWP